MEEEIQKTKLKINMCTHRRLNIEHKINENLRKQNHLSNLNFHKYKEQIFYQKINHFRLLNFKSETEKRLLCQSSSKLPNISQKRDSREIRGVLLNRSWRSAINYPFSYKQKTFQSYLNQQIIDEQQKQIQNNQRRNSLLKEFDELKHTIDDPNSAFSVLAALSRALLFIDSGRE